MIGMCSNASFKNLLFIGYFVHVHDQGLTMNHVDMILQKLVFQSTWHQMKLHSWIKQTHTNTKSNHNSLRMISHLTMDIVR